MTYLGDDMDRAKIDECLAEVPAEIRSAVRPLDNDKAWAIYILLLKRRQMRFNEIKNEFNVKSPGDIDRYLKGLVNAGLVSKEARRLGEVGDNEAAYYAPTDLGISLLSGLFRSVLPQAESTPKNPTAREESSGDREHVGIYPDSTEDQSPLLVCRDSSTEYRSGGVVGRRQPRVVTKRERWHLKERLKRRRIGPGSAGKDCRSTDTIRRLNSG